MVKVKLGKGLAKRLPNEQPEIAFIKCGKCLGLFIRQVFGIVHLTSVWKVFGVHLTSSFFDLASMQHPNRE